MIGRSKNNTENYLRKCFWTQERETRVKRWSAFEQLGPGSISALLVANHKPRTENGECPRSSPPISAAPLSIFKVIKREFSVSHKMDPQQQNNGFGPISKPRGRTSVITASFLIVLSGAIHCVYFKIAYSSEDKEGRVEFHFLLFGFALLILSFVLGELVRRLCLVSEEIRHKETRYKGSWKKVFTSTFTFRHGRTVLVVVIASLLFVFYFLYEHCNTCCRSEYAILFSLNCFISPLLSFLIRCGYMAGNRSRFSKY